MVPERRSDKKNTTIAVGPSQSLARGLAVLELVAEAGEELGVRDIARRVSLAPSIAQRLVSTLAALGYLEQSPTTLKYRVGYRAFQVGGAYIAHSDVNQASLPELRQLAERHDLNGFLGVLRDRKIVYLATVQSRGPIAIRNVPGSETFLHSTALGKALLAEKPESEVVELLGEEPFKALTAKTKTSLSAILQELAEVRRLGYAISDEENLDHVFATGAAVRDATGQAVAAISGALPRNQLRDEEIMQLCALVKEAADRVSRRLGAPGPAGRAAGVAARGSSVRRAG